MKEVPTFGKDQVISAVLSADGAGEEAHAERERVRTWFQLLKVWN